MEKQNLFKGEILMNISNINLGKLFKKGDLGRHGRFAAVEGGDTQGHVKRKRKSVYFVYPKPSTFVPDTEKCPSPWLIHLR